MLLRANSAPYKLLGCMGAGTTTIDFVLPNRRYETIRGGEAKWWFSTSDDGDSGDGFDLPDRCDVRRGTFFTTFRL